MILPHLQDVDDLPDVITGTFYYLIDSVSVNMESLFSTNLSDSPNNGIFCRFHKFQIQTVVHQGLQLTVLPIIANANYGCFSLFDDLNEGAESTSIPRTDAIYLIHDNHRFLSHTSAQHSSQGVLVFLLPTQTRHTEIIQGLIGRQYLKHVLYGVFVSSITSIGL